MTLPDRLAHESTSDQYASCKNLVSGLLGTRVAVPLSLLFVLPSILLIV